jgi:hypothetical protein
MVRRVFAKPKQGLYMAALERVKKQC